METIVADQTVCLELAAGEKTQMTSETADLRERFIKVEEKIAELEATNSAFNTALDEAIRS